MSDGRSSPIDDSRVDPWDQVITPQPVSPLISAPLLQKKGVGVDWHINRLVEWKGESFMTKDPDVTIEQRYADYFRFAHRVTAFDLHKHNLAHHHFSILVQVVLNVGQLEVPYAHRRAQSHLTDASAEPSLGENKKPSFDVEGDPPSPQSHLTDGSAEPSLGESKPSFDVEGDPPSPATLAIGYDSGDDDDGSDCGASIFSRAAKSSRALSRASSATTFAPDETPTPSGFSAPVASSSTGHLRHVRGRKTPIGWTDAHAYRKHPSPKRVYVPTPLMERTVNTRASHSPDSVSTVEEQPSPKKTRLTPLLESPSSPSP